MKLLKTSMLFVIFSSINLSAQFSLDSFLNDSFDQNITSIKEKLADKKFEEQDVLIYKTLLYYEWLEPISVKVGFMFRKDGKQNGKILTNGKNNDEDSQKLFDMSKVSLIKKYGSNYAENSMLGNTVFSWKGIEDYSVTLSRKSGRTMLMIMKK